MRVDLKKSGKLSIIHEEGETSKETMDAYDHLDLYKSAYNLHSIDHILENHNFKDAKAKEEVDEATSELPTFEKKEKSKSKKTETLEADD